mmetsp:Transcript_2899/g.369  ORF Transcript_2899/g.369 Transcript_2899/m.369 type:complete len:83 (+) Transcript_2899:218-466(+)
MLTFDEFITLLSKVEKQLSVDDEPGQPEDFKNSKEVLPDTKVLDFLRLLEEYRKKCEDEGNYTEAKKAKVKYDELRKKETIR